LFISPDVKRPNNDLLPLQLFNQFPVCLKLRLFRRVIIRLEVQELAAEKADAARVIFQDRVRISYTSDICKDIDMFTVDRDVFPASELLEKLFAFSVFFALSSIS